MNCVNNCKAHDAMFFNARVEYETPKCSVKPESNHYSYNKDYRVAQKNVINPLK